MILWKNLNKLANPIDINSRTKCVCVCMVCLCMVCVSVF